MYAPAGSAQGAAFGMYSSPESASSTPLAKRSRHEIPEETISIEDEQALAAMEAQHASSQSSVSASRALHLSHTAPAVGQSALPLGQAAPAFGQSVQAGPAFGLSVSEQAALFQSTLPQSQQNETRPVQTESKSPQAEDSQSETRPAHSFPPPNSLQMPSLSVPAQMPSASSSTSEKSISTKITKRPNNKCSYSAHNLCVFDASPKIPWVPPEKCGSCDNFLHHMCHTNLDSDGELSKKCYKCYMLSKKK
jgi:hypothetical protein